MYLQKLTDLVCTEKQINDDLKQLRFGTKFNKYDVICGFVIESTDKRDDGKIIGRGNKFYSKKEVLKNLIGNPLELHHLMWYCLKKNLPFVISGKHIYTFDNLEKFTLKSKLKIITKYDNKKPLSLQSEEVLKNIFEALSS